MYTCKNSLTFFLNYEGLRIVMIIKKLNLRILTIFAIAVSFINVNADDSVSDENISEITQRLESYSTSQLQDRRLFLLAQVETLIPQLFSR